MFKRMIILLIADYSLTEKMSILAGMLLFVCLLYFVLPKFMRRRIKGYYEQCEFNEEEQKGEEQKSEI